MIDRIVIEGQLIRHERIETLSEAPLESLAQHLVKRIATTLPVLPSHPVRYLHFDGESERGMFLIETPPALRHIKVKHSPVNESRYVGDCERRDRSGTGVWRVQFPWQYFQFTFHTMLHGQALTNFAIDDTALFWSKDQLRGADHPLITAPVPNVDSSGHICWGETHADNTSLNARIDDYINNFTTTTFNEDLGHRTPFNRSLTEWEEHSAADLNPMAWREWSIWDEIESLTPETLSQNLEPGTMPPMAELNPSFIELPVAPANFTVMRARQYLDVLSPAARQRFVAALAMVDEPIPEEVPA